MSQENSTNSSFKEQCRKAAEALAESDVLMVVAGAGFSADSGLGVYGDVAKIPAYQKRNLEYADVSQPAMIHKDPELYYGFWGHSLNTYRNTKPHEGYDILAKWRDEKHHTQISKDIQEAIRAKVEERKPFDDDELRRLTPYNVEDGPAGAFHVFTSNVDAHSYDFFGAQEIHDCHGNIELWQCSSRDCDSGIWRAPVPHRFVVDEDTMLAPESAADADDTSTYHSTVRPNLLRGMPHGLDETGWRLDKGSNWPRCGHCNALARPAIFCFGDFGWKYDRSQEARWNLWRETVLEACAKDNAVSVCILEIGCGTNVPTCRSTSEQLVEDVLQKGGRARLVRINPDSPRAPEGSLAEKHTISIQSKGLCAVQQIDSFYYSQDR